jgi:hypothetical protein
MHDWWINGDYCIVSGCFSIKRTKLSNFKKKTIWSIYYLFLGIDSRRKPQGRSRLNTKEEATLLIMKKEVGKWVHLVEGEGR